MTGLVRTEQRAGLLERGVGRQAERLVQQQDAGDGAVEAASHMGAIGESACYWLVVVVVVDVTLRIVLDGVLDQRRQARAALDQLVLHEPQLRAVAHAERAAERAAQQRRGRLEDFLRLRGWRRAPSSTPSRSSSPSTRALPSA